MEAEGANLRKFLICMVKKWYLLSTIVQILIKLGDHGPFGLHKGPPVDRRRDQCTSGIPPCRSGHPNLVNLIEPADGKLMREKDEILCSFNKKCLDRLQFWKEKKVKTFFLVLQPNTNDNHPGPDLCWAE
jgi:hypothetical protein